MKLRMENGALKKLSHRRSFLSRAADLSQFSILNSQISRITVVLFALIAILAPPPSLALDVNDPPTGVFSDEWYAIMLNNKKSGHAHSTMERRKQGGRDIVRTKTEMRLEAGRAGQTIAVTVTQQTEETLGGEPLAFMQSMRMGALPMPMLTRGTIKNGKVRVKSTQFGSEGQEQVYDLPEGAMMSWAVYREQIKRGLAPGTKYELPMYEPSVAPGKLLPAKFEVLDKETIDLFGRKVETVRTKQVLGIQNMLGQTTDVETITWLTPEGDPVRVQMEIMNFPIEMLACTKSVAMAPNDPAELMVETLIPVSQPVDRSAAKITYRLRVKPGAKKVKLPELPETSIQKIDREAPGEIVVTVTRPAGDAGGGSGKLTDEERERYLTASSTVNYKDPVVAELVKQAAGNEKDSYKLADRLRRFVSDYVREKNLNVGFATASEVARSREGDCTEHGVLLAALGRGAGIPTRLVTGLIYTDQFAGRQNIFAGHLWTQFWLDGQWVDLDAAQDQTVVEPTHIALSISDAADTGLADMVNSIWLNLGHFTIDVMEPSEPAK